MLHQRSDRLRIRVVAAAAAAAQLVDVQTGDGSARGCVSKSCTTLVAVKGLLEVPRKLQVLVADEGWGGEGVG